MPKKFKRRKPLKFARRQAPAITVSELALTVDDLAMQLGEVLLRTRFIMDMFEWKRGSVIAGPGGKPITITGGTMYDYFMTHREEIIERLSTPRSRANEQAAHSEGSREAAPVPGSTPDAAASGEPGTVDDLQFNARSETVA